MAHLKILCTGNVKYINFHTEDAQITGAHPHPHLHAHPHPQTKNILHDNLVPGTCVPTCNVTSVDKEADR